KLAGKAATAEKAKPAEAAAPNPVSDILFGRTGPRGGRQTQGLLEAMAKSAARTVGSSVGREIVRGVLGSILGAGKRRR
ncbi:MAG TPA: helicase HerA-like domain-containing protein, partial [Burkholderiales bacterium]|nr:helicase HerA-like domain-containing protein [Burkholderiales bacterium]